MDQALPNYEQRRALLARNPLACAEGFKVLVILTLRHLFGVRFCPRCPDCAKSNSPCTDSFGSNAMATGGIFGRMDAVFGSVECQKAGTLHLHLQGVVQCFHQFTPLSELVAMGKEPLLEMLRRYSSYTAHACQENHLCRSEEVGGRGAHGARRPMAKVQGKQPHGEPSKLPAARRCHDGCRQMAQRIPGHGRGGSTEAQATPRPPTHRPKWGATATSTLPGPKGPGEMQRRL